MEPVDITSEYEFSPIRMTFSLISLIFIYLYLLHLILYDFILFTVYYRSINRCKYWLLIQLLLKSENENNHKVYEMLCYV